MNKDILWFQRIVCQKCNGEKYLKNEKEQYIKCSECNGVGVHHFTKCGICGVIIEGQIRICDKCTIKEIEKVWKEDK